MWQEPVEVLNDFRFNFLFGSLSRPE